MRVTRHVILRSFLLQGTHLWRQEDRVRRRRREPRCGRWRVCLPRMHGGVLIRWQPHFLNRGIASCWRRARRAKHCAMASRECSTGDIPEWCRSLALMYSKTCIKPRWQTMPMQVEKGALTSISGFRLLHAPLLGAVARFAAKHFSSRDGAILTDRTSDSYRSSSNAL